MQSHTLIPMSVDLIMQLAEASETSRSQSLLTMAQMALSILNSSIKLDIIAGQELTKKSLQELLHAIDKLEHQTGLVSKGADLEFSVQKVQFHSLMTVYRAEQRFCSLLELEQAMLDILDQRLLNSHCMLLIAMLTNEPETLGEITDDTA